MDIAASDARERWGDFMAAAMSGSRINITQHGTPRLAVVTVERLDQLEYVERQAQKFIAEESGGEPWPPPPE